MFSLRTQSILCVTCCVVGTYDHFPAPVESAATLGARQGPPGTRPVRAPRTSPTAAMSTARSSIGSNAACIIRLSVYEVRAGCRLPHFVLGRSGIDSLPGTLPRLRRGTLPAKSQEPALLGKALCALSPSICSLFLCRSVLHCAVASFRTPLPRASRMARQWPALHSGHRLAQYGIAELLSAIVYVGPRRSGDFCSSVTYSLEIAKSCD